MSLNVKIKHDRETNWKIIEIQRIPFCAVMAHSLLHGIWWWTEHQKRELNFSAEHGMNSSADSSVLNKGLRDQDSRYLMPTYRAITFLSPDNIYIFKKWLHRASSRHLGPKGQPYINSLALDLVQSNWEIYLRFNNLVQQLLYHNKLSTTNFV